MKWWFDASWSFIWFYFLFYLFIHNVHRNIDSTFFFFVHVSFLLLFFLWVCFSICYCSLLKNSLTIYSQSITDFNVHIWFIKISLKTYTYVYLTFCSVLSHFVLFNILLLSLVEHLEVYHMHVSSVISW